MSPQQNNSQNDDAALPLEEGQVYSSHMVGEDTVSSPSSVRQDSTQPLPVENIEQYQEDQGVAQPVPQTYDQQVQQQASQQAPDQQTYQDVYGAYTNDEEYPSTAGSFQDAPQDYQQQPELPPAQYAEEHPFIAPQVASSGNGSSGLFAWYAIRIIAVLVVVGLFIGGGVGIYRAVSPTNEEPIAAEEETQEIYEGDGSDIAQTEQPTTEWECQDGYTADSEDETICRKDSTKVVNVKKAYSCPSGYLKSGSGASTRCQKTVGASSTQSTSLRVSYSCPSGYTGSSSRCSRVVKKSVMKSYSCRTDYTKSGNGANTICKKIDTRYGTVKVTCPAGYSTQGSSTSATCRKTINATKTTNYKCKNGFTKSGNGAKTTCKKWKKQTNGTCPKDYKKRQGKCLRTIAPTTSTSYSCPSQYTKSESGTSCLAYTAPSFSCSADYAKSGSGTSTRCKKITVYRTTPYVKRTCPSGYRSAGSNSCQKTVVQSANKKYYCPTGYGQSGSKCYRSVGGSVSETDPTVKRSCPKGYKLLSDKEKCSKENSDVKTAQLIERCDDGWDLLEDTENGSQCVLTESSDT